jgi:hypothetical protein
MVSKSALRPFRSSGFVFNPGADAMLFCAFLEQHGGSFDGNARPEHA